jgi:hypothetical protein
MKTTCHIIIILALLISVSCKSSKSTTTQAEIDNLNTIVSNNHYRIESDWAYPQVTAAVQQVMNSGLLPPGSSGSGVSLIGNSNFIEIKGDSISSYLPYFGERQMQVGYNTNDSAIQFDGIMEDYKVVKGKKDAYDISFSAMSKSEKFNVNITIFPNLSTNVTLNSGSRLGIRYSGEAISQ